MNSTIHAYKGGLFLTVLILAFSSLMMVCGKVLAVSPGAHYRRSGDRCGFWGSRSAVV